MSTMQWIMLCFGYISCLGLSFFLSGMETGLAELSRLRLRRKAREGNANAGRLQNIVDHPEDMLWTILVGNTLANLFVFLSSLFFLQQLMGIHSPEEILIHLTQFLTTAEQVILHFAPSGDEEYQSRHSPQQVDQRAKHKIHQCKQV